MKTKNIFLLLFIISSISLTAQTLNPTPSIAASGSADTFKGGYTFSYASSGTPWNGSLISFGGFFNNYDTQISADYGPAGGNHISFRTKNGDVNGGAGVWNPWIELASRGSNIFTGNQTIAGSLYLGTTSVNANTTKLFLNNPAGKNWAFSSGLNNISENTFGIYNWTASQTAPFFSITDTGNVGIGTTTPKEKLDILGNARISSYSPNLILQRDTASGGFTQGIQTKMLDGTNNWFFGNVQPTTWVVSKGDYSNPFLSVFDNGNMSLGSSYPGNALTIIKTAPANSHIYFGNPKAIAGQSSANLTFAGYGIQHSGFAWIPGTNADNGKLNLSFGEANDPSVNNVGFTFQSNGNLGIGMKDPEGKMDINANGNIPIIRGNGGYIPTGLRFIDDSYTQAGQVKEWAIWKGNSWSKGLAFNRYDAVNRCAGGICDVSLFLHDNGNVGVGNLVNPTAQLHVKAPGLGTPFDAMIVDVASFNTGANAIASSYFKVRDIGAGNLVPFIIRGDGNVGIGTTSPDEKLTVKGKIHAQEVRIDLADPIKIPDYVFANDYKLKTLNEVETYIKANSHLPEIPSAKEMAQTGMLVSEMNLSLLKKIEELTLYAIEQQKKLEEQNKAMAEQNAMNAEQNKVMLAQQEQLKLLANRLSSLEKK
jgi:uncharacterized coiled-coil protein SlyX